jgi:2-keto-4-pentenoate hydratase/2-oxohepta-3-ene-1,7-dioic acid hydratase in catechol pathway
MRIARIATPRGPELAAVDPAAGIWQRTGNAAPGDWLVPGALPVTGRLAAPEPIDTARLLPPLVPRCLVGVGLNYRAHAAEQGRALPADPPLFLKNPHSLAPPFGPLPLHPASDALDYEAELGIVIGRPIFACSRAEAEAAIAGWLVVQDYTLRDLARPETLTIAKGGPAMAPIGPWLTTVESLTVAQAATLAIRCRVNGELRQNSTTADMHFGPAELVHRIARHLPLGPGDVIATGSPGGSGVGFDPPRWLAAGDTVETEIEGLGRLCQQVVRNS